MSWMPNEGPQLFSPTTNSPSDTKGIGNSPRYQFAVFLKMKRSPTLRMYHLRRVIKMQRRRNPLLFSDLIVAKRAFMSIWLALMRLHLGDTIIYNNPWDVIYNIQPARSSMWWESVEHYWILVFKPLIFYFRTYLISCVNMWTFKRLGSSPLKGYPGWLKRPELHSYSITAF